MERQRPLFRGKIHAFRENAVISSSFSNCVTLALSLFPPVSFNIEKVDTSAKASVDAQQSSGFVQISSCEARKSKSSLISANVRFTLSDEVTLSVSMPFTT